MTIVMATLKICLVIFVLCISRIVGFALKATTGFAQRGQLIGANKHRSPNNPTEVFSRSIRLSSRNNHLLFGRLFAKKYSLDDEDDAMSTTTSPKALAQPMPHNPPDLYNGFRESEIGPPPDLPSLLLHNRIIYIGSTLTPAVSELVIAQLLYLNQLQQHSATGGVSPSLLPPITLYINSPGTTLPPDSRGRVYSFDTEAFAIADTILFIQCPIRTICIGQAYGTAAMLLALGTKGQRYALPNAQMMLHQPHGRTHGQASDIAIKAKELVATRQVTNGLLAQACGKDFSAVERDASRACYLSPDEAVDYGLIDKVLHPTVDKKDDGRHIGISSIPASDRPKFLDFL